MLKAARLEDETRTALITRLKSIEGQSRGIQRMLDEGRDCQQIMTQLTALRAASHAVTMQALEALAQYCLRESTNAPDDAINDLMGAVSKLLR